VWKKYLLYNLKGKESLPAPGLAHRNHLFVLWMTAQNVCILQVNLQGSYPPPPLPHPPFRGLSGPVETVRGKNQILCHSKPSDLRQAPLCLSSRPGRLSFEGMFPGRREKPGKRRKQIIVYSDFFFSSSQQPIVCFQLCHIRNPGRKQKDSCSKNPDQRAERWDFEREEKKNRVWNVCLHSKDVGTMILCLWYCRHF